MGIGEVRARRSDAVNAGGGHGRVRVVRLDITPAQVVGEDQGDVLVHCDVCGLLIC